MPEGTPDVILPPVMSTGLVSAQPAALGAAYMNGSSYQAVSTAPTSYPIAPTVQEIALQVPVARDIGTRPKEALAPAQFPLGAANTAAPVPTPSQGNFDQASRTSAASSASSEMQEQIESHAVVTEGAVLNLNILGFLLCGV